MRDADKLIPLQLELKKVAALGGSMALVVVPDKYADKVLNGKRDLDTSVHFQDYQVIGMIGAGANEASASFLSVPKGIAVFPADGDTVQTLFFLALERLKLLGSSHWVKRLWENIKESAAAEHKHEPEARFITATYYQFYSFLVANQDKLGQVFNLMPSSGEEWVREFLPYGTVSSITPQELQNEIDMDKIIDGWGYHERLKAKVDKGVKSLRKFRNMELVFTLPSIATQIITLAEDETASASKMAKVIENDPVLTSKLLKVVNSAFYGFHRQINSVEHAIMILGNDEVVNLSFSIAIRKLLDGVPQDKASKLWEHSLIVALLAQKIGPLLSVTSAEKLYTMGLLHDLGKIVLLQKGEFAASCDTYSSLDDLAREEQEHGISHAEIGAFVAERWQLPEVIVDGILAHHLPSKAQMRPLSVTMHVADYLGNMGELDLSGMNFAAVQFLKEASFDVEMAQKYYLEIKDRVKFILEI